MNGAKKAMVRFLYKMVRSKSFIVFASFLVLSFIFNTVFPPLGFIFVVATYLSGIILILWIVSSFPPEPE